MQICHKYVGYTLKRVAIICLLFFGLAYAPTIVSAGELTGYAALESRLFPESGLFPDQFAHGNVSLVLHPEYFHEWDEGTQRLTIAPFLRVDQHDGERTHFDLRELYWEKISDIWEIRIGLRKIFWGVVEAQHLVDVINQTDLVENINGEAKLGQPMVHFSLIQNWGTLDAFVLPYFRERTFPGDDGRLRAPLRIDTDRATYTSGAEETHLDWAVRWSHYIDIVDIGIAHFSGTGREPVLREGADESGVPFLVPHYQQIEQTGLDLQATTGGWLWKLEALRRDDQGSPWYAAAGGFEYTFGDIAASGIDLGLLLEYHYDERGSRATTPFDDDIFAGARVAFNDVQSTDILAGALIDRDSGAGIVTAEASRRLGDSWRLYIELNTFFGTSQDNLLDGFRRDSYVQVELAKYF